MLTSDREGVDLFPETVALNTVNKHHCFYESNKMTSRQKGGDKQMNQDITG